MGKIARIQLGIWSYAWVIPLLCISVTPAFGELLSRGGKIHGTTLVSIPSPICTVHIDSQGRLLGSCSKISVTHSDPGTFCAKTSSVAVSLSGLIGNTYIFYPVPPSPLQPNLCSFNGIAFEPVLPISNTPDQRTKVREYFDYECWKFGRSGGQTSFLHPVFGQRVVLDLKYNNGDWYNEAHTLPPLNLTCDPCPPLIVKKSIRLQVNAQVSIPFTSLISGGVPPYTFMRWQNLPAGLSVDPTGNLTGQPVLATWAESQLDVRDSCGSGNAWIRETIGISVVEAPKISWFSLNPTTFDSFGGKITAYIGASDDRGVAEVRLVITNPNGSQTAVPRLPQTSGAPPVWAYSWVLPGNTTSSPMIYGIQARVYDVDGLMTPSQTLSVTIPGKPASTLPLPSPTGLPRLR